MMKLLEVPEGKEVVVKDIIGGYGMKRRLASLGIYPGAKIRVLKSPPGPLIVEVCKSKFALGKGMAKRISVKGEEG